jgi:hypothetical protein
MPLLDYERRLLQRALQGEATERPSLDLAAETPSLVRPSCPAVASRGGQPSPKRTET